MSMPGEVHLLVMIHGMWGTPNNLSQAKKTISEKYATSILDQASPVHETCGTRLDILVVQTNQTSSTYDGIDWGGERVAEEVYERVAKLEQRAVYKVTSFSLFGYSLGGLLARYVVGILHSRKFFNSVKPVNFSTFATPHIGLPRYRSFLSSISATLGPKLLSRTGEQFYGSDTWGKDKKPLLEVMADKERIFWRALSLFPHVHIYANSVSDPTVPFVTAAIELEDPFLPLHTNELDVELDPTYEALIHSYHRVPSTTSSKFSVRSFIPSRPFLPPPLKRGFVFETTLLVLLPIVLPTVISLAVFRLASDSHASRSRIRRLEAEKSSTKLVYMLDDIEHAVENLIAPITDQSEQEQLPASMVVPQSITECPPSSEMIRKDRKLSSAHPNLTKSQIEMVHSLNALTQMKKHFAFFHPVRNSHGLIISRDREMARRVGGEWEAFTQQGESVLRHWADGFVL